MNNINTYYTNGVFGATVFFSREENVKSPSIIALFIIFIIFSLLLLIARGYTIAAKNAYLSSPTDFDDYDAVRRDEIIRYRHNIAVDLLFALCTSFSVQFNPDAMQISTDEKDITTIYYQIDFCVIFNCMIKWRGGQKLLRTLKITFLDAELNEKSPYKKSKRFIFKDNLLPLDKIYKFTQGCAKIVQKKEEEVFKSSSDIMNAAIDFVFNATAAKLDDNEVINLMLSSLNDMEESFRKKKHRSKDVVTAYCKLLLFIKTFYREDFIQMYMNNGADQLDNEDNQSKYL